ncbi:TIGR04222 domain-containing membrane protein [Streptomyces sp. AC536]|uniref:TIGR04222 domain-containing membrane protein n=1 Tax=Streptomyces buecherae TaxID=2763006 RepID=UPI00164E6FD9|nr:TIGR04222 domain-containing membrane protein [Streptomyces buecherae]MBC3983673.1 TIGR04222 domain-containing membrane protein [Streptomyces buecherae]QNJ39564.1 TIGR04222 domain-containing membrane protein [Streptomyces buecherae]
MLWVLFLVIAWVAAFVTCARLCQAAVAAAQGPDAASSTGRDRALTLYEAAFLSGGPYRVSDLALVAMHRERRLLLAHTGWVTVVDPVGRDEMERSLLRAIGSAGQAPVPPVRSAVAAAEPVRALADRLVMAGLAVPDAARAGVAAAIAHVRGACALILVSAVAALVMVPPETGTGTVAAWFALPLVATTGCLAIARVEVHPYTRWASPAGQQRLGQILVPPREDRLPGGTARPADGPAPHPGDRGVPDARGERDAWDDGHERGDRGDRADDQPPAGPGAGDDAPRATAGAEGPAERGVPGGGPVPSEPYDPNGPAERAERAALTILAIHGAAGLSDPALRAALRGGRRRTLP